MVNVLMVSMFHMLYVVYVHGGVVTLLDIPSGGKKWLKSFKHLRRGMAYNL